MLIGAKDIFDEDAASILASGKGNGLGGLDQCEGECGEVESRELVANELVVAALDPKAAGAGRPLVPIVARANVLGPLTCEALEHGVTWAADRRRHLLGRVENPPQISERRRSLSMGSTAAAKTKLWVPSSEEVKESCLKIPVQWANVETLGAVEELARDQFHHLVNFCPLNVLRGPLWEIRAVACSSKGFCSILSVSYQPVADAKAMQAAIDDVVFAAGSFMEGKKLKPGASLPLGAGLCSDMFEPISSLKVLSCVRKVTAKFEALPPDVGRSIPEKRSTVIHERSLSTCETQRFIESCQTVGCSVSGALLAAMELPVAELLCAGSRRRVPVIQLSTTVDTRTLRKDVVASETPVGNMAGSILLRSKLRVDVNRFHFDWAAAKTFSRELALKRADGSVTAALRLAETLPAKILAELMGSRNSTEGPRQGRTSSLQVSNLGVRGPRKPTAGSLRLDSFTWAIPSSFSSGSWNMSVSTVGGRLSLAVYACEEVVGVGTAEAVADMVHAQMLRTPETADANASFKSQDAVLVKSSSCVVQ